MDKRLKHGVTVGTYEKGGKTKKLPKIYSTWSMMKQRCHNKKHIAYNRYGGRGIKVCKKWKNSFEQFYLDMNDSMEKHVKKHGKKYTQLDRTDNDRGYSKENCRWVTPKIQLNNTRVSVRITLKDEIFTLTEFSKKFGIKKSTLRSRIDDNWTPEEMARDRRAVFNFKLKQQKEIIEKGFHKIALSTREKKIIKLRFGIGTYPRSCDDVSKDVPICRERVRQIINEVVLRTKTEFSC